MTWWRWWYWTSRRLGWTRKLVVTRGTCCSDTAPSVRWCWRHTSWTRRTCSVTGSPSWPAEWCAAVARRSSWRTNTVNVSTVSWPVLTVQFVSVLLRLWFIWRFPFSALNCWLRDTNCIQPIKSWVLVCWWWRFDWSFARLLVPVVITITSVIPPLPFGRICFVVLVMRKGGESSWSGPWHLGCTSKVFHVHNCQDQFIQPRWAECVYI